MNNYIVEFLKNNNHIGADRGIKAAELLAATGQNTSPDSQRHLKAVIRCFRLNWRESDGIETFILSDTEHGYYLMSNIQEVKCFAQAQKNRAIKAFETSQHIRKYLREHEQLEQED